MKLNSTFLLLKPNNYNSVFKINAYLIKKLKKIPLKVILNKINIFNLYESLVNYNYFCLNKNNYLQDLINTKLNSYFNFLFNDNTSLKIYCKNKKKNNNLFLFNSNITYIPLYLEISINHPKLNNIFFNKDYFEFLAKINNNNDKILIETRARYNVYAILNYNISLNSYYDFFSNEMYNLLILAKHLSNKDNLKITSIYHLLISLHISGLFNSGTFELKNEFYLNTINKLVKKEKIKTKNLVNFSFFNLIMLYINSLYFDLKTLLLRDKNLIKRTFISKKIKILFQYIIQLNKFSFKSIDLIPEFIFFILINVKNLKISKVFLSVLNNNIKKSTIKLNSTIYNKILKNNNKNFILLSQQYYLFLLKRTVSDYELEIFLNSIYNKQILNYFRCLVLKNTLNKFTKKNLYKTFIKDILIINIHRNY